MNTKPAAYELSSDEAAFVAREPVAWYLGAAAQNTAAAKPMRKAARDVFMKQFGQRCRIARVDAKLDIGDVADQVGVHRNTIWNIERGDSLPDAFELELLARVLGASLAALLGPTHEGRERDVAFSVPKSIRAVEIGDFVYVPHFDIEAAAGLSELFNEVESVKAMRPFDSAYIRGELGIRHNEIVLINVNGNSMEPTLHSKDTTMIDLRSREVYSEGIHVIRLDDALLIKKVQRLPGKVLRVISENQDYEPFEIRPNEESTRHFEVVGRVVWGGVTFK